MAFTSVLGDIDFGGFQLGEVGVTGAGDLNPTGITGPHAVGTPAIAGPLNPTGIASTAAVGSPSMQSGQTLGPFGIASAAAVGSVGISMRLAPTGIASPKAVGTPAFSTLISVAGIAGPHAVGTPAFLIVGKAYTLFINNIDRTDYLKANTLNVVMALNERSSATLVLQDLNAGAYAPAHGQPIAFYLGTTKRFAGRIQKISTRNENGSDIILYPVTATGWDGILDRRRITFSYDSTYGTLTAIVSDIISRVLAGEGFGLGTISSAITMAANHKFQFVGRTITEAFNELAEYFQVDWKVDWDKLIHMQDGFATVPAPYNLADSGVHMAHNTPKVTYAMDAYANRVIVRSTSGIAPLWCDTVTGTQSPKYGNVLNGTDRFFVTHWTLRSQPRVRVDGTEQTVAELSDIGTTSGWKWYWIDDGFGVMQRMSETPLNSGQELEICYQADVPNLISVQNDAAIAARAAVEGGTGIYEAVIDVPNLPSYEAALAIANGVLDRRSTVQTEVEWDSFTQGTEPGQTMTIALSKPLVASGTFMLDRVSFGERDDSLRAVAPFFVYSNRARSGPSSGSESRFVDRLISGIARPKDRELEIHTFFLITGSLSVGTGVTNSTEAQSDGIIKEARVSLNTGGQPVGSSAIFDLKRNGVSIFGSTKLVLPAGKTQANTSFFQNEPYYVTKGDKFTLDITQIGSTTAGGDGAVYLTLIKS